MADYRRYWVPGGTYFFTLVTHERAPIFDEPINVARLRTALSMVQKEQPFDFCAAVILPDHMHFLWALPSGDCDYAKRIGRTKVFFTQLVRKGGDVGLSIQGSRQKHRESDIWQRRFWEHAVDDEQHLQDYLDYIHYNPVKHGWVSCPHAWEASSFRHWVSRGLYEAEWGCRCAGRGGTVSLPKLNSDMGEP